MDKGSCDVEDKSSSLTNLPQVSVRGREKLIPE